MSFRVLNCPLFPAYMLSLSLVTLCVRRPALVDDGAAKAQLKNLIHQCWHPLPDKRPSFEEIVAEIAELQTRSSSPGSETSDPDSVGPEYAVPGGWTSTSAAGDEGLISDDAVSASSSVSPLLDGAE